MEKVTDTFVYIYLAIKSIFSDVALKILFTVFYIGYAFFFDEAHTKSIVAVIVLIMIDFVTGISAAKYTGEEIKSAKVFRSAVKVVIYLTLISSAHLLEVASIITFADDTVIAFLAATELISLIENIGKMGFAVPRQMLNKLQKYRDSK